MSFKSQSMITIVSIIGCIFSLLSPNAYASKHELVYPDSVTSSIVLKVDKALLTNNSEQSLQVFVGPVDDCCSMRTPMAGRYASNENSLSFKPAFNFEPGQSYTVLTRFKELSGETVNELNGFSIPSNIEVEAPYIVSIYPSGDSIPENTLRFYVQFSAPMQPHVSSEYIKLINAVGEVDDAAFMSFKQELWSEDRRRLTVLMDPGRIKRGVAQNLTLGSALNEGSHYFIVINEGWPNARGEPLLATHKKAFTATQALRRLPDTKLWKTRVPERNSLNPLIIEFDRPFDYALLSSSIVVLDSFGHPITGNVSIENHERKWVFMPRSSWDQQQITVVVDAHLEDVAGNNFRDLLDHSMGTKLNSVDSIKLNLILNGK